MKPWPLEKIPRLGERAVTAIVQSIAQAEMGRHGMPGFVACPPQDFSAMRWQDFGLGPEGVANVARQCNAMFRASLAPPNLAEECGRLPLRILEHWGDGPVAVTFFTSGSTGKPKPCTHPESHLRQEITSLAPLVENCTSALVTAPLHHMYGFTFGLLLPLSLGIPVRCVPPLPTLAQAQMKPGDMVVGIPLLWSRLADLRGWKERASEEGRGVTALTPRLPCLLMWRTPCCVRAFVSSSSSVLRKWALFAIASTLTILLNCCPIFPAAKGRMPTCWSVASRKGSAGCIPCRTLSPGWTSAVCSPAGVLTPPCRWGE